MSKTQNNSLASLSNVNFLLSMAASQPKTHSYKGYLFYDNRGLQQPKCRYRYFILQDKVLYGSKRPHSKVLFRISVEDNAISIEHNYRILQEFTITKGDKTWRFVASNAEIAANWVNTLQRATYNSCFPFKRHYEGHMTFHDFKHQSKQLYFVLYKGYLLGAESSHSTKLSIKISIKGALIEETAYDNSFTIKQTNGKIWCFAYELDTKSCKKIVRKDPIHVWIKKLQSAAKLLISDVYVFGNEIVYDDGLTYYIAKHKVNGQEAIIKSVHKFKWLSKERFMNEIEQMEQLEEYQNVLVFNDTYEDDNFYHMIFNLKRTLHRYSEGIIWNVLNEITNIFISYDHDCSDFILLAIIVYVMVTGIGLKWSNGGPEFALQERQWRNISDSLKELVIDLFKNGLKVKNDDELIVSRESSRYLAKIRDYVNWEEIFLRGCHMSNNSSMQNLRLLLSGYVRRMGQSVYQRTPEVIISICIEYTLDVFRNGKDRVSLFTSNYHFNAPLDSYKFHHQIAKISFHQSLSLFKMCNIINATNLASQENVIIIEKDGNESTMLRQKLLLQRLEDFQSAIKLFDLFTDSKSFYFVLKLDENGKHYSEKIVCNVMNKMANWMLDLEMDKRDNSICWIIGIIAYVMLSGYRPSSWSNPKKFKQIPSEEFSEDKLHCSESMRILIQDLLHTDLWIDRIRLNKIVSSTSSESLFMKARFSYYNDKKYNIWHINSHQIIKDINHLLHGYFHKISSRLYKKLTQDILSNCTMFIFDVNKLRKLDYSTKEQRELEPMFGLITNWSFIFSTDFMRRKLLIKTKSNQAYLMSKTKIHIQNGDELICAQELLKDGDVIRILMLCGYKNIIRVSVNGKELETYVARIHIKTLAQPAIGPNTICRQVSIQKHKSYTIVQQD